jgi:hypothetical protein
MAGERSTSAGDIGRAPGKDKALGLPSGPNESTTGLEVGESARNPLPERIREGFKSSPEIGALPDKSSKTSREVLDLSALRVAADNLSARLEEVLRSYRPTDNVSAKETTEICLALTVHIGALEDYLGESIRTQIAFAEILREDMSALRDRVTALEGCEDVQPTVFDEIGQTLLVWTISLAVGAVIGGPTLAYLQHATLSSKLAEGAISGVAGRIASEVVRLINRPAR